MVKSFYNRAFTSKTANNAWIFFEEIAKNMLEWELVSIDAKQPTITTTTTNQAICIESIPISRMIPEWQY